MEIYLVRHGQSTGNDQGRLMGWSDHPLTELGRAQAEAIAARLAPLGPMAVLCSDLPRALETAEIIAARWHVAVETDARWREISCGDFENATWDEYNRHTELAAAFDLDPVGTAMPGGESMRDMLTRVVAAFDDLRNRTDAQIVIATHDGPIRSILAHCLRLDPDRFWTITTNHGGLTALTISDDWTSVRMVNDTSHLSGVLV